MSREPRRIAPKSLATSQKRRVVRQSEPVVWIIDSEQWPRACLRAELIERGYDAYGFVELNDAIDALSRRTAQSPVAVILELRGQHLTRELLKAIRSLEVPTIVLGGTTEFNDALVQEYSWDAVLRRPISLGAIADLVQKWKTRSERQ
jgi:DNA-binding NtrC family response regulator